MIHYILLLLLSLTPYYSDSETWEQRTARMNILAESIDHATSWATCSDKYKATEEKPCTPQTTLSKKDLALVIVTQGWFESRFAKHVHEGHCGDKECDPTHVKGVLIHRARTPWQIQFTGFVRKDEWDSMVGASLEETKVAAHVMARITVKGFGRCKTISGIFSAFTGGASCTWIGEKRRYTFFSKLKVMKEEDLQKQADRERERLEKRLDKSPIGT